MTCSEGDQLLAGAFHAIMDQMKGDMLQIAIKMGLKMYLLTSSIFFQKDSSYKCHFSIKFRAPPNLVSQVYAWVK